MASIDADTLAGLQAALRAAGFRGDYESDRPSRIAVSTDNSIYQIEPIAVVAPRDADDVACLMRTLARPDFAAISVTGRGGGTGTNGQSLTDGLVVDFQRHMKRILHVDADGLWADVEPGIVLAELNEQLSARGLFFAPSTSTANRCTIGGMVSTDASGKGSRRYGKTSDNVLGLDAVLADGRALSSLEAPSSSARALLEEVAAACDAGMAGFKAHVPVLPRRFTGYDLPGARPGGEALAWWRLFFGAEGTLGLITRIRVRLLRKPAKRALAVIAFSTVSDALAAGPHLLQADPLAIEVMDEYVAGLADGAGQLAVMPEDMRGGADAAYAYNFVEFAGDDPGQVQSAARALCATAQAFPGFRAAHAFEGEEEMAAMWTARAAAVGLLGKVQGRRRPIAFIEDCVVPVENLSAFVADFVAALKAKGLVFGIYGHVDVGCLHIRPALDMDDPDDRAVMAALSDEIYALTNRHGGILWGEHGKGIRGQYLRDFVGEDAYTAFIRIKTAFDPAGRLNPGKLVPVDAARRGIATTPFRRVNAAPTDVFERAFRCNGNALCQSYERTTPMCPSFKATRDFRHSPKGRADVLRDWKTSASTGAERRALEEEAFAALDLCLGCKACATSCPVQVDIPQMKSHFLARYYETRWRPVADRLVMALEQHAGLLQRFRRLVRPFARAAHPLLRAVFGLVDLPDIDGGARTGAVPLSQLRGRVLDPQAVFILQDPFNGLFDGRSVSGVVRCLERLGYKPVLLPLLAGGKAAHVLGDLKRFDGQARRMTDLLNEVAAFGRPVVGIDPAFVNMLRQEYQKAGLVPGVQVHLLQEFLAARAAADPWPKIAVQPARILLHCTESVSFAKTRKDWQTVFDRLGARVDIRPTGCCGMAGIFGHRSKNLDISERLFDLSWRKQLEQGGNVYATGFSCRSQAKRFGDRDLKHPAHIIADAS